jgi:hypothetical protein
LNTAEGIAQIFGLHPEAIAVQTEKFERDLI